MKEKMQFLKFHIPNSCLKLFVIIFISSFLIQIILVILYKSLNRNLFFSNSKNERFIYFKNSHTQNISQLFEYYFHHKELFYKKLEKETQVQSVLDKLKANQNNESDLILQFDWNNKNISSLDINYKLNGVSLPYFFQKNFTFRPNEKVKFFSRLAIWPEQASHDRIINQLMYIPENYDKKELNEKKKFKKILIYNQKHRFSLKEVPNGQSKFLMDNCPVNTCEITRYNSDAENVDAIFFNEKVVQLHHKRNPNQIWIYYNLESPTNSYSNKYKKIINWTATYREDSDLVAPYSKFVYYFNDIKMLPNDRNFLLSKTKNIAWFVSNCKTDNKRGYYINKLSKLIDVDIYGKCGFLQCSRKIDDECFEILRKNYKYYASFENSNCRNYITEKFFLNSLQYDIVPIVFGPDINDYLKVAPKNSFINVEEFRNVSELAKFLYFVNSNSSFYNKFFEWKNTGEFINTFFWCRLCALLHAPIRTKIYEDLDKWWNSPNICNNKKIMNYI